MPIPSEILAVKRPKNTVVIAYGKNKDKYAVRQRIGCKNVDGRHLPVNGPTIGHIINGEYVELETNSSVSTIANHQVDLKDWGNIYLCDRIFNDMIDELGEVYSREDSLKLYCISILRVCNPGIKDYELKEAYETSFLSELYPDVSLSKNTVSTFWNNLGKTCSLITSFMSNRTATVNLDHHLLVDGTLKTNNSIVNTLSEFSRKSRIKGTKDISVLYAFDLESMEPVCSRCYPGNMLDATAYGNFIKENKIKKGIVVGDKGFPSSSNQEEFDNNPDLHYLNPIKRNAKLITTHDMYDFTAILPGYEGITYRKEKCNGKDKWLYSFRNSYSAAIEEQGWLEAARKKGTYSLEELKKKQQSFGTIVLECDLDIPPETAYKVYDKRWEIELVMRYYKLSCEFNETRVHDDYSVIGSEFCNFLSTVLTFRLLAEFDKIELLNSNTYKQIMTVLAKAKKIRVDNGEWTLNKLTVTNYTMLQTLDLVPKDLEPEDATAESGKRKRGRPKGSKNN